MKPKRRLLRRITAALGVLLVAGTLLWKSVGAPSLEALPAGYKETYQLAGNLSLGYDPWTLNRVDPPRDLQFSMVQTATTEALPDGNVAGTLHQSSQASAAVNTVGESRYVLDPVTRRNVRSDDAWANDPSNVIDRSPAYSLALPAGFDPNRRYPWFEGSTDRIYDIVPTGARPEVEGVGLVRFGLSFTGPASHSYLLNLAGFGLPESLTAADIYKMSPDPSADPAVIAALRAAIPDLPADVQPIVTRAVDEPVPVSYSISGKILFDFEPRTGVLVRAEEVTHELFVEVDVTNLREAAVALRDSGTPVGSELAARLGSLEDTGRFPVFTYTIVQTPESSAAVARSVEERIRTLQLLGTWTPIAVVVLGAALVAIGLWPRRPRTPGQEADEESPGEDGGNAADAGDAGRDWLAHEEAAAGHG